ncbi:LysR substrate-binding domain-containing protein [Leifsonia aquatica]|uniref:DNA-binding transcriptional LysR family regulator n=2 Tax=Leifsonia aquatica TaxID=144185 RepID=A0A7W4YJ67_LEIAQ|nr:LysR substrate-binding domain-containing protein [Leifsonia aquatica]MBB2968093.1 DNA-binding transcriptional LysR family regulator [Leifsonia aquatica]
MREPDLDSLRLLVGVAASGSLSRAAQAAGVSQQAASARMAALERDLGVALLTRTSHGTSPTEAGAIVVEWATELLAAVDRFSSATAALRAPASGSLRVAASMTISEHLAPAWLTALRAAEPGVRIELTAANSVGVVEAVRGGAADLGFIETPDLPSGLPHRTIATDELVVVVGPRHPWARRRSGVTAAELAAAPLVVRESGSGTRLALERALAEAGLAPVEPALALSTTSAIRSTVAAGAGPAALSILAVRDQLAQGTLVQVRVLDLRVIRPLTAIWSGGATPTSSAAAHLLRLATR